MKNHTVALKAANANPVYGINGYSPIPIASEVNVVSATIVFIATIFTLAFVIETYPSAEAYHWPKRTTKCTATTEASTEQPFYIYW